MVIGQLCITKIEFDNLAILNELLIKKFTCYAIPLKLKSSKIPLVHINNRKVVKQIKQTFEL
jgi:hypothetical protein